jgi:hypothetical protein
MDDARDRGTRLEPIPEAAAEDVERAEEVEGKIAKVLPDLHAGTTGAEARDRLHEPDPPAGGPADPNAAPPIYGTREEVLERVVEEQADIEGAQGSTPAADPSQRSGFTRILHAWTLVGALLGAGVGAFAGWLAVAYRDASYQLIIALAAVGLLVGAVIVGASRVAREDGRVDRAVEAEVQARGQGTPGDEEPDEQPAQPAGTRSGG